LYVPGNHLLIPALRAAGYLFQHICTEIVPCAKSGDNNADVSVEAKQELKNDDLVRGWCIVASCIDF
jgi:hypothetical protein